MRRPLVVLLVLPLLLSACGGGGGDTAELCRDVYWDGTAGLCLPEGWTVVDRETLNQRGVPEEVIAAFQAEESASGQFPTVTVTEEQLPDPAIDAETYSAASIRSVSTLPGYALIDTRRVVIDGVNLDMHVFSAQPLSDEPERRFYQISAVTDGFGYTFTALTPLAISSDLEREILSIMQSATLEEPENAMEEGS